MKNNAEAKKDKAAYQRAYYEANKNKAQHHQGGTL